MRDMKATLKVSGSRGKFLVLLFAAGFFTIATSGRAEAQEGRQLGGHFGVALPLLTRGDGRTTNISDDFTVAFPTGLTVKTNSPYTFDFELVPSVRRQGHQMNVTIHPGVIRGLCNGYAAGIRAAFDLRQDSWGFTPLVAKGFPLKGGTRYFVELDLPVRFQERANGGRFTSVTLAIHTGIGF